jgi:phosphatidylglycerophosphatase A
VGRIPIAPGTFGSFVGLLWFGLLLATGHWWSLLLGTLAGFVLSVWLCGWGEKTLRQKDPGSVVLDEITALPVCFGSWIGLLFWKTGALPRVDYFLSKKTLLLTFGVFIAFRIFDIWKPWPVRQSQNLPGGWGITVDDFLAAIYVSLLVLAIGIWAYSR